ncbi:MAG TPA: ROK family protein [Verrucomicrobiae bacterium]|nr:ROK family protein [Verrucomicrobiae bacterium]
MLIAIDTGGTKTLVTSFYRDGKPHKSYRFQTPHDKRDYLTALAALVNQHYSLQKVSAIVIAVPGVVKNNRAVWCDNLGWKDFNIPLGLKKLGITVPVFLENDANLAALGEVRRLKQIPSLALYLTVSTGIGSGLIVDGHIQPATSNSEAGHMVLNFHGHYQEWETFASGRALKATYQKLARDIPETDTKTWQEVAEKISVGLLALIPSLQPEIIIIGGSIGTYFQRYKSFLDDILKSQLNEHFPIPPVIQARFPEEAVLYGCFCYGSDRSFN